MQPVTPYLIHWQTKLTKHFRSWPQRIHIDSSDSEVLTSAPSPSLCLSFCCPFPLFSFFFLEMRNLVQKRDHRLRGS